MPKDSFFSSGWRPSSGWVCVAGLGYTFIIWPAVAWVSGIMQVPPPPPLDMGDLIALLVGMLGIGSMRSFDKLKNKEVP